MDRIRIVCGQKLNGSIAISGAKNAALPLMIASLLSRDTLTLQGVPRLSDVRLLMRILGNHGVDAAISGKRAGQLTDNGDTITLSARDIVRYDGALRTCCENAREFLGARAACGAHG